MNKRLWSVAVALAMLLSMVCSVFVVSADETQAGNVEDQIVTADSSGVTSLELTPSASDIAVGHEFTVDLSLANYNNDWATFATELTYDASAVEYLGYDENAVSEDLFISIEKDTNKLIIIILSNNGENISITDLLTLKFKATAKSTNPISASFVADSVAGYSADGTSDYIAAGSYSATAVTPQISIAKKTPYLTMRLEDENGDPITSIKQGDEIRAIVTLNDYYDPWMAMTLSLNYDASKFSYKETGKEDLGAFVSDNEGEMMVAIAQPDDPNNPLSVCFMSSDLKNRSLKEGTSADILELTLVAKATAASGEAEIGTSFVENGNMKTDPATEETVVLTKDTDFLEEAAEGKGSASVSIETVERPWLTLVDQNGKDLTNLKVIQGDSFTVNVKINNFKQAWSAMSFIAQFDNTFFEVDEDAFETANENLLFGDYVIPYVSGGTLGVSILSSEGDVGIDGGEGIVLKIPMKAIEDVDLSKEIDPIKIFFAPDGNISGGKEVDNGLYETNKENPAKVEMVVAQSRPSLSIQLADDSNITVDENGKPIINQGNSFTLNVMIHNFNQAWSAMSLIAKFNNTVFEVDEAALEAANTNPLFGDYVIPYVSGGTLGVSILSSEGDVSLTGGVTEGIILKIPMIAKEDADLETIEVFFAPEGNIANGETVSSDLYLSGSDAPASFDVKVVNQGKPQVKIEAIQATDAEDNPVDLNNNLKAGDKVQFKVSVENFVDAWSIMTLQVGFDSDIFELVPVSDGNYAVDSKPFIYPEDDISSFFTEVNDGNLAACWFNGNDLEMKNKTLQEVMTFTLKVKEEYTLTEVNQAISAGFQPDGNYAGDNLLVGSDPSDPNKESAFISGTVDVTVKVEPSEAPSVLVEISWGAMEFTYNFGTWNPTDHVWDGAGWTCATDANKITVTNKGEVDVTAAFAFTPQATGVLGAFYDNQNELIEGIKPVDKENGLNAFLKLSQTSEPDTDVTTLGTIKVTIDKV